MKNNYVIFIIFLMTIGCSTNVSKTESISESESMSQKIMRTSEDENINLGSEKMLSTYPIKIVKKENNHIEGNIFNILNGNNTSGVLKIMYFGNRKERATNDLEKLSCYSYKFFHTNEMLYLVNNEGKYKKNNFSITNTYPITKNLKNILDEFDTLSYSDLLERPRKMNILFRESSIYPLDYVNITINNWNAKFMIKGFNVNNQNKLFLKHIYKVSNKNKNIRILVEAESNRKKIYMTEDFKSMIIIEYNHNYFSLNNPDDYSKE